MPPDAKQQTLSVHEKLLELGGLGLSSEEINIVKTITDARPVKIDLEVFLPGPSEPKKPGKSSGDPKNPDRVAISEAEVEAKAALMQGKAAVREVCNRYDTFLGKPLAQALRLVIAKYNEDQAGQAGGYAAAEAALSKVNKFIEGKCEDFRVDLRESIAKRLGIHAKQLMTVGRVSVKEISILSGSFNSEVDFSDDKTKGNDLAGCFKKKKWQYCGAAFDSAEGKVFVDAKKKFKKADLKKLEDLFQADERNSLKFAKGQVQAESETNLHFEFLKKDGNKLPGNDGVIRKLLMRGLKNQTGKNYSAIEVKVVEKYSAEVGSTTKSDDTDGKGPKKPETKTPTPSKSPTPSTGKK
ncbi:MAG: hypothetical protein K8U03_21715 [Planctomycetia bacterium]|nr:hypothetical protein [Planctomycetia bacterium]